MKESYGEGVATHADPESCVSARKGGHEASTGARAGQVSSRERISLRNADAVEDGGRQHLKRRYRETLRGSARSETLRTHGNTMHGNREIPGLPAAIGTAGRVGKPKGGIRR